MNQSFFTLAQQNTAATKAVQTPASQEAKATVEVPADGNAPVQDGPKTLWEGMGSMFPMLIIMGVLIYFMWRGQKKDQKRRQEMIDGVKVGDKVVTIGGIFGEIVTVKEQSFIVKIADNTRIELMKSAVSSVPAAGGEEPQK